MGNSEAMALLLLQKRWPGNNNTMHMLWVLHFHSNKNRSDSLSLLSRYYSTQSVPPLRSSSYRPTSFSNPSRGLPCAASSPTVTQLFPLPDRGHQDLASTLDKEIRSTPCFQTTALYFCHNESREARGNEPWPTSPMKQEEMSHDPHVEYYWCFHKANVYTEPNSNVFVYIIAMLLKFGI